MIRKIKNAILKDLPLNFPKFLPTTKLALFTSIVLFFCVLSVTNAGEAVKFVGEIYLPNSSDFGFAVNDKKTRTYSSEYLLGWVIPSKNGQSIFLLAAIPKNKGGGGIVYDAIDVPRGLSLIGSPEEECKAKNYPEETIFVIGKWTNKKTSDGDFSGGYASLIVNAWKVNFENKKLELIPIADISCEDNRTDADVN